MRKWNLIIYWLICLAKKETASSNSQARLPKCHTLNLYNSHSQSSYRKLTPILGLFSEPLFFFFFSLISEWKKKQVPNTPDIWHNPATHFGTDKTSNVTVSTSGCTETVQWQHQRQFYKMWCDRKIYRTKKWLRGQFERNLWQFC